jgi:hemoglobin
MKKLAALALVVIAACGGKSQPSTTAKSDSKAEAPKGDAKATNDAPAKGGSLYDRLGGKPAITAVVDEFVANLAGDDRIKHRFFNTDIPRLKILLVDFVCLATGGPCKYTGQDMETSHAGMELVDEEFTALVEDLVAALDKFKVPAKEKGEILGALGPLQPAIVTPKDRLKPVSPALIAKATATAVKLDGQAAELMQAAIVAAKRGQRNYADQLFSRVEQIAGAQKVAAAADTFRAGAPPRIDTPLKKMPKDTPPQPRISGNSEEDEPKNARGPASLRGTMTVDGQPLDGLGTVMLWPVNGGGKRRTPKQRVVEQRDKTFYPRVLAVPPGSTVAFPNFDGVFHNVFSISATKKFDVGLYKDGDTRELKFEKAGIVRLGCNIHAKMASWIVVVDAPNYVVVEGAKEFNFRVLKPGKYKVRAWSEKSAGPLESVITIKAGVNTMTFDVKGDAEGGPGEDKFGMTRQVAKPPAPPKKP